MRRTVDHIVAVVHIGLRIYGWDVGEEGALEPIGSWDGVPAAVAGLAAS